MHENIERFGEVEGVRMSIVVSRHDPARVIVLCDCGESFSAPLRGTATCPAPGCGSTYQMESFIKEV